VKLPSRDVFILCEIGGLYGEEPGGMKDYVEMGAKARDTDSHLEERYRD